MWGKKNNNFEIWNNLRSYYTNFELHFFFYWLKIVLKRHNLTCFLLMLGAWDSQYIFVDDFEHAMSSLMYINVYWLDTKQENIYKAFIET